MAPYMRTFSELEPNEQHEVIREYRKARKPHTGQACDTGNAYLHIEQAKHALRAAIVSVCWDAAEADGYVKLDIVPDDSPDLSFLEQDFVTERYRKETYDRANADGVWGIQGMYRTDTDDDSRHAWEHADSCFGFIGDDWKGSGYDTDIKRQTLEALDSALDSIDCAMAESANVDTFAGPSAGMELS